MEKYTKGPWIRSGHGFQVLTNDSMQSIATIKDTSNFEEQIDNAAIIAAAPVMYEALRKLSKGNRSPGVLKIARESLKAIVWEGLS